MTECQVAVLEVRLAVFTPEFRVFMQVTTCAYSIIDCMAVIGGSPTEQENR